MVIPWTKSYPVGVHGLISVSPGSLKWKGLGTTAVQYIAAVWWKFTVSFEPLITPQVIALIVKSDCGENEKESTI